MAYSPVSLMGIKFKWDPSLGGIKGPTCEYLYAQVQGAGTRRYSRYLYFRAYDSFMGIKLRYPRVFKYLLVP